MRKTPEKTIDSAELQPLDILIYLDKRSIFW